MTQHAVARMETSPFYGKAFPCTQVCNPVQTRPLRRLVWSYLSLVSTYPGILDCIRALPSAFRKEKPNHSMGVGEQNKLR